MARSIVSLLFAIQLFFQGCPGVLCRLLDFLDDFGAIPFDESKEACQHNSDLLARILQHNASNNVLRVPFNQTFYLHHGIAAQGVNNSVIQLDGTLRFQRIDFPDDPHHACLKITRTRNFTLTSNYRGLIDGQGS